MIYGWVGENNLVLLKKPTFMYSVPGNYNTQSVLLLND
jgi:hypothetical protein